MGTLPGIFLIIDEASNLTPQAVKTIITLADEGMKAVFVDDNDQPYLDSPSSGLSYTAATLNCPVLSGLFG